MDSGNNRVVRLSATGIFLGAFGSYGTGNANFDGPTAISTDPMGNIYVVDTNNHRVQRFDPSGAFINYWGAYGTGGNGNFNHPEGIKILSNGDVLVSDTGNGRVQVFNAAGTYLSEFGTSGSGNNQFVRPKGIAEAANGNIYVVDAGNKRISVYDHFFAFVKFINPALGNSSFGQDSLASIILTNNALYITDKGANGIVSYTYDGNLNERWGTWENCGCQKFNTPTGIGYSPYYNLAFVSNLNVAYGINTSNESDYTSFWPTSPPAYSFAFDSIGGTSLSVGYTQDMIYVGGGHLPATSNPKGSPGTGDGQFLSPTTAAIDSNGFIFVADSGNNRIQKLSSAGIYQTKWGTLGNGIGQLNNPMGVAVNVSGYVFVADTNNNRVQVFDGVGNFVRQWGSAGSAVGQFLSPTALAIDSLGRVFVADTNNSRIQVFSQTGAFDQAWGTRGIGPGEMIEPVGVAVSTSGTVYVVDKALHRVAIFPVPTPTPSGITVGSGLLSAAKPGVVGPVPVKRGGKLTVFLDPTFPLGGQANLLNQVGEKICAVDLFAASVSIDTAAIVPGVYFFVAESGGIQIRQRIVITP